jgi:hypothetical protein
MAFPTRPAETLAELIGAEAQSLIGSISVAVPMQTMIWTGGSTGLRTALEPKLRLHPPTERRSSGTALSKLVQAARN